MTSFDDAGAYVPWRVRRNTDWKKQFRIKLGGSIVDMTGDSVEMKVVASEEDNTTVIKNLSPSIVGLISGNAVLVDVAAANTNVAPGVYWWYFKWTDSSESAVIPLMSGPFTVEPHP